MPVTCFDDALTQRLIQRLPATCLQVFDVGRLVAVARLDPQPGGGDFLPLVIETFASSLAQQRGQMQAAQHAQDGQTLHQLAHTLKASARGVGALRLGDAAARLDVSLRALSCSAASVVQLQPLVVELLHEVDLARAAGSALIHELKGQDERGEPINGAIAGAVSGRTG